MVVCSRVIERQPVPSLLVGERLVRARARCGSPSPTVRHMGGGVAGDLASARSTTNYPAAIARLECADAEFAGRRPVREPRRVTDS